MDIPHPRVYIGLKQTVKAVKNHEVKRVILAEDADGYLSQQVLKLCHEYHITVEKGESRLAMGRHYGVDVGAAVVAILK